MSISRRQFILGTGAGLILPSYYDKIFAYFENTGEALLDVPRNAEIELIADFDLGSEYELNLGAPHQEPPEMTVREYARRYFAGEENYLYLREEDDVDFERKMDFWEVIDTWARTDSPNARAYRLLENLDLGPDLCGENAVGRIDFIDGDRPGSDYLGAHAPGQLDLALLQKRLNDLDTGIRILMA
ncbi:MAG: hypothetical protein DRI30_05825 [Chloroflexi bacterium]|nr:MAG: hypothetical protein DRI30_05825 [Chloroflexota bacterium]